MAAMGKVCAHLSLLLTVAVHSATEPKRNFKEEETLLTVVKTMTWASGGVVIIVIVAAVCIVRRRSGMPRGQPTQAQTSSCVGSNLSPADPDTDKDTGSSLEVPYDHLCYHGDAEINRTSDKNLYDHLCQQEGQENNSS
ncbi:uncharacterized protein LOC112568468 [Pomacea canaliculata]|uniref:uncharacterized protein LOC112568468 n=1 Tax=Pomacea canaliculata TaxID=400727 RepID=UPI000D737818|nr:uncharacterized protein LOC112568468 [Pomacea canaliculata]